MPNPDVIQSSFIGGEIDPSLWGRYDMKRYADSLRKCLNTLVTPHGAALNRPGTKYVGAVKDQTVPVRLIPFVFSLDQSMVLEFGNLYVRFYQGGKLITSTASIPDYSNTTTYALGAFVGVVATYDPYPVLYFQSLQAGNLGNAPNASIPGGGTTAWWAPAPAGAPMEVVTPYAASEVVALKYAQSGNVITICHPNHPPYDLKRVGVRNWTMAEAIITRPRAPNAPSVVVSQAASIGHPAAMWEWVVTAVDVNGIESLPSPPATAFCPIDISNPVVLKCDSVNGAVEYRWYRGRHKVWGYVGSVGPAMNEAATGAALNVDPAWNPLTMYTNFVGRPSWQYPFGTKPQVFVAYAGHRYLAGLETTQPNLNMQPDINSAPVGGPRGAYWYDYGAEPTIDSTGQTVAEGVVRFQEDGTFPPNFNDSPPVGTEPFGSITPTYGPAHAGYNTPNPSPGAGYKVYALNDLVSSIPITGAYAAGTTYAKGAIVMATYTTFGWAYTAYFVSLQNGNLGNTPAQDPALGSIEANPAWWHNIPEYDQTYGAVRIYKSLQAANGAHPVSDAAWWADQGMEQWVRYGAVTASDYPACVAYFDDRRIYGNTQRSPSRIVGSQVGNYYDFDVAPIPRDSDGVDFMLAARSYDEIQSLLPGRVLFAFCRQTEWVITGGNGPNSPITPSSIFARANSYRGSTKLDPIAIGNIVLFVQAKTCAVRELQFDFYTNSYGGDDISLLAQHFFLNNQIVSWCYAQTPYNIVWAVRDDGILIGLTYNKEQQIQAWHQHATGLDAADAFEQIVTVPEGTEDAIYVVVRRTANGVTNRYVERFASRRVPRKGDGTIDVSQGTFLDSATEYVAGVNQTVYTGLSYLGNRTVYALVNGVMQGPLVVVGNQVTLSAAPTVGSRVLIGLAYLSEIQLLDLVMPGQSVRSRLKNIYRLSFNVVDTQGMKVGDSESDLQDWQLGKNAPFTGLDHIRVNSNFDHDVYPVFQQPYPYPMCIDGVGREVTLGGD